MYEDLYSDPYDAGLDTPLTVTPTSGDPSAMSPLLAGLQLGIVGAGAGLGVAAIRRGLLNQATHPGQVAVIRPVLIGATIGAALGSGLSLANRGKPRQDAPSTWRDLSNDIVQRGVQMSKYSGLHKLAFHEKQAIPLLALLPLAWKGLMLAGTAYGAYGAAKHGVGAVSNLAKGDLAGAGKSLLYAGGNALQALPGVGVAGRVLGRVGGAFAGAGRLGRLANYGNRVVSPATRTAIARQAFRGSNALDALSKSRAVAWANKPLGTMASFAVPTGPSGMPPGPGNVGNPGYQTTRAPMQQTPYGPFRIRPQGMPEIYNPLLR